MHTQTDKIALSSLYFRHIIHCVAAVCNLHIIRIHNR